MLYFAIDEKLVIKCPGKTSFEISVIPGCLKYVRAVINTNTKTERIVAMNKSFKIIFLSKTALFYFYKVRTVFGGLLNQLSSEPNPERSVATKLIVVLQPAQ